MNRKMVRELKDEENGVAAQMWEFDDHFNIMIYDIEAEEYYPFITRISKSLPAEVLENAWARTVSDEFTFTVQL